VLETNTELRWEREYICPTVTQFPCADIISLVSLYCREVNDPHQSVFVWKHALLIDLFSLTVQTTIMANVHRIHLMTLSIVEALKNGAPLTSRHMANRDFSKVPTNLAILYSHLVCFSLSKLSRNWTWNQQGKVRNINSCNYIIVSVDAKILMHFRCQNALVCSSHRTGINSFSSIVFGSATIHHNTVGCCTLNF